MPTPPQTAPFQVIMPPLPRPEPRLPAVIQAGSRGIWKDTRSKPLAA